MRHRVIPRYDIPRSHDQLTEAFYAAEMTWTPDIAVVLGRARPVARRAGRGLIDVLIGPNLPPVWRRPWLRLVTYVLLGLATVALAVVSIYGLAGQPVSFEVIGNGSVTLAQLPPSSADALARTQAATMAALLPTMRAALPGGPMTLMVLVALAALAPFPLAVRYPLLGWRVGWLALLLVPFVSAYWWHGMPWEPTQLLVLVVTFAVAGVRHRRAMLWWMWTLTLVPWWFWVERQALGVLIGALGTIVLTAIAVGADSMRSRRRARQSLADQTERTELERARRAVLAERTRIARELHDVVAHHMSLIAVRAETAPYRISDLPEPVRTEFTALSATAREALNDMRRLLGLLRDDEPGSRAPQPRLSDLSELVDSAREAGLPVRLSVPAGTDRVPAGVGVCAYRIVQESLSNAGRHAPGAPIEVSVDHEADTVLLRVANGPAAAPGHGQGAGHGLSGMRERVALLGGSLTAGPLPDGGFVVSAVLPMGSTP